MEDQKDNIGKIVEKLDAVGDAELKDMVMKLIEEREYLISSANIDPLSGLNNRRILSTDKIRNIAFCAMIDVDRFKTINDTYGHDVGDSVIRIVGSVLKHSTRREDFVIRYGGDEFLIVFTGGTLQIVTERIDRIRQEIKEKVNLPGFEVTLSVGVAPYEVGATLEETIKKADESLYHSKNTGKDKVTIYGEGPEMNLS